MLSSLVEPIDRLRRGISVPRAILGMTLAHIGLGIFVVAVTAVESYTRERDVAMAVGDSAPVGEYQYRFTKLERIEGPNYDGVRGEVQVYEGGKLLATLHPEKRQYWVQRSVMTEAGISMQLSRDLFAALGEDLGAGRWSVRAQVRPLINYVWLAAFLMAIGGAIAASDRRYRATAAAREPLAAGTAPSGGAAG
ncbi:MAG: cytochrome c-type biogenesis CcmF C-terminal domain-containing protein [Steroidobacteraceae bacterium]